MKATKKETVVKQLELVETYNIYRSLDRLINTGSFDSERYKRAIVHALGMVQGTSYRQIQEKVRIALELP